MLQEGQGRSQVGGVRREWEAGTLDHSHLDMVSAQVSASVPLLSQALKLTVKGKSSSINQLMITTKLGQEHKQKRRPQQTFGRRDANRGSYNLKCPAEGFLLAAQWFRLHSSTAGDSGSLELRSYRPQGVAERQK